MIISYILLFILLAHIYIFKKLIFKWNIFGVFFIATFTFSTLGILLFPTFRTFLSNAFWSFNIDYITNEVIIKTQIIAVSGVLLVLYAYVFGLMLFTGKVVALDHFSFKEIIKDNLSKTNYYFILIIIALFLLVYLFIQRDILISGVLYGLIARDPSTILIARRAITSNYLYVVILYNLLPFLSIVSYYIYLKKRTFLNKLLFFTTFTISFLLLLMLFQKRPLILFILSFLLAVFVLRKHLKVVIVKKEKYISKVATRIKYIKYGILVFGILLFMYYLSTNYKFQTVYQAVKTLSEVVLVRVFGRLTLPAFFYVHHFPDIRPHYYLSNIGMLTKILPIDFFADNKVLFNYYSNSKKDGSLAINAIFDFYGAFGYYGLIIGNILLGLLLSTMDVILDKLEKNGINLIFIIFCFVFAYYLSQASLSRSLMGYGFIFFVLLWAYLQRGFKIKLR